MSEIITVLVCDDEPLCVEGIKTLLSRSNYFRLVGEASDGSKALELLQTLKPDLVFLDIKMPIMSGLDILEQIDENEFPEIIFTTAYNEYALAAFEARAIDFLLKPYSEDRFFAALEKARKQILGTRLEMYSENVMDLIKHLQQRRSKGLEYFEGKIKHHLKYDDIIELTASGNYTTINSAQKDILIRESLKSIIQRLPELLFFRINHSTAINLGSILSLSKNHDSVIMKDKSEHKISRRKKADFIERLNRLNKLK